VSRLRTPYVGVLIAVLVLVFGSVATGEDNRRTAVGDAFLAPAPVRDQPIASAAPIHPSAQASPSPKARQSKPAKAQKSRRANSQAINKTAAQSLRKSQSRPAKRTAGNHRGTVYLTFDDGPSKYTPAILKILRRTRSTATFFEVGFRQARYPAAAEQIRAQGSSIGNHTYNHPDLTALTPGQIRSQLSRGPRSKCMRPPFGATNSRVRRIVAQQGLREVLWTIDTNDWSRPGTAQIVRTATGPGVGAGSNVLLHDGGGDRSQTVAALPKIIKTLQQRGYVIRRIPGC